jgi:hypothetical protein
MKRACWMVIIVNKKNRGFQFSDKIRIISAGVNLAGIFGHDTPSKKDGINPVL